MPTWQILDLGTQPYREVWARQLELVECRQRGEVPDTLLLVEHPHVITLGTSTPDDVIESIRRNGVALKGPVATAMGTGFESITVRLRKALDLYANLRPVRNLPGVESRFGQVDLIIVRENTEDLYAGLEHEVVPGVVQSLKIITEKASTRIAAFAFDYARAYHRKKVTAIHKANIMKKSDGLFLDCFRRVAADYPDADVFTSAQTDSKGKYVLESKLERKVKYSILIYAKSYKPAGMDNFTISDKDQDPLELNATLNK